MDRQSLWLMCKTQRRDFVRNTCNMDLHWNFVFIFLSLWTLLMSYKYTRHLYPFRNILCVASFVLGLCMMYFAICHSYTLLLPSLFTKLRTVTVSITMSVGLSVCLLICISWLPEDGFLCAENFYLICWEITVIVKIRQKKALYAKKLLHI